MNSLQVGFVSDALIMRNGKPVTTSRKVAEVFDKRHADVLRSITMSEASQEFNERNFALVDYKALNGERRPEYIITRDGFTFLAMGFTGKVAAKFKEQYINAFNTMEARAVMQHPSVSDTDALLVTALTTLTEYLQRKQFLDKMSENDCDHLMLPEIVDSRKKLTTHNGTTLKVDTDVPIPKRGDFGWRKILDALDVNESFLYDKKHINTVNLIRSRFFHNRNYKRFTQTTKNVPAGKVRIFRIN